jgi:hypothetical protein
MNKATMSLMPNHRTVSLILTQLQFFRKLGETIGALPEAASDDTLATPKALQLHSFLSD